MDHPRAEGPKGQEVEAEAICGKRKGAAKRERLGHRPHFLSPKPVWEAWRLSLGNFPKPLLPRRPPPISGRDVSDRPPQPCTESAGARSHRAQGGAPHFPSASPTLPRGRPAGAQTLT